MEKKELKCKKHKTHKSKKLKKSRKPESSSNDSDSSYEEWVEKKTEIPSTSNTNKSSRDTWMLNPFSIPTVSKQKRDSDNSTESPIEKAKYDSRELNPFWKNGGTGLPDNVPTENVKLCAVTTGDHGVEWLYKSLQRCKERAKDENRPLEDVAADHWGSLDKLKSLIAEAESRCGRTDDGRKKSHAFTYGKSSGSKMFIKPRDDVDDHSVANKRFYDHTKSHRSVGWRKPKHRAADSEEEVLASDSRDVSEQPNENEKTKIVSSEVDLNSLAAKLLKAKMSRNETLVKELSDQLDKAKNAKNNSSSKDNAVERNVVILTKTNSQGFCQPVKGQTSVDSQQKRKKFETYVDGKRVRYFEDDEKYSLKEMFENEKMTSIRDQNLAFSNLISKSKDTKDHDTDDIFSDQITDKPKAKSHVEEAVRIHKKNEKILDNCDRCLNSVNIIKHLVIMMGTKSYLSIPSYKSLTEGQCLIIPTYHVTCGTLVDEDVWQEMKMFCKQLVNMFRDKQMDVVFYEIATRFNRLPHMILHCVPLPRTIGNLAPVYFKKAILECEKEWAINKKLVNVQHMNVKRSVPKGLPYFMVHFGMDVGFAHVIENEKEFPTNFAEEIIGGMLDIDHTIWRKHRNENFETQCKKVSKFKHWWKDYDWQNE